MVGNISDIKMLMPTRLYRPTMPTMKIAPNEHIAAPIAKSMSKRRVLIYFIKKVEMKRPERNRVIAKMLYFCAVALSIPR